MRTERRTVTARAFPVPAWVRTPLSPAAQQQMAIIQLQLLADVHHGRGTEATLWDLVRNGLTWSAVAQLVGAGEEELAEYLELLTRLVLHYGATGRVEFTSAADDATARLASAYMEDLAALATWAQAQQAARWSEEQTRQWQTGHARKKRAS